MIWYEFVDTQMKLDKIKQHYIQTVNSLRRDE